jgi:hypothetical protein
MSIVMPSHLAVEATRALAWSAMPDAPVEPDRVRTRPRALGFLRALFRPATGRTPGRLHRQTNPARC